ncbi:class I SAM-dependent methyltransferase [Lacticaseibacillus brantae]|uniref:Methylase for ubiquinone menaquinone biosynthesis n=1 Tax=Lacticaseibacillus brantae DSM 23927 TaxID=1423727 RepID=A0A0R2AW23_9LACO|nr:class I SAM-dependent methyltransferase [Lacticaseibacillus brantae]KRM71592.1 methylase for ubiquinone menaquinone biosynthesis [Lacticaseibacillus brantae DSM 23927]
MDTPESWDDFAQTYTEIQAESQLPIQSDVVKTLINHHLLPAQSVLDLASGSGRYGLKLAEHATEVTLLDWSTNMLTLAKKAAKKRQLNNITYTTADWHTYRQSADLVFISQLPTLKVTDLPRISQLSRQAVAINHQTRQDDHLLAEGAAWLGIPVPPVYQADANLMADYRAWLQATNQPFKRQVFTYHRTEAVTIADLVPEFDVPLGVNQVAAMAQALTGDKDPHQPVDDVIDYQFELLTWLT